MQENVVLELAKLQCGVKGVLSWHESHNYRLTGISRRLAASHWAGTLGAPLSFRGLHYPTLYGKRNREPYYTHV